MTTYIFLWSFLTAFMLGIMAAACGLLALFSDLRELAGRACVWLALAAAGCFCIALGALNAMPR